jgi:hypothetical protein
MKTPKSCVAGGPANEELRDSDCIFEGTIRDYPVLDERKQIVTAGASRNYHMELSRPATGPRSSCHTAVSAHKSQPCAGEIEQNPVPRAISGAAVKELD